MTRHEHIFLRSSPIWKRPKRFESISPETEQLKQEPESQLGYGPTAWVRGCGQNQLVQGLHAPGPLRCAVRDRPPRPHPFPGFAVGTRGPATGTKQCPERKIAPDTQPCARSPGNAPSAARATLLRGLDYMHRISAPGYQLLVTVPRVTQSGVGFRGSTQPTGDAIFMLGHSIGHDITTVRDRCPVLSVVRKGF